MRSLISKVAIGLSCAAGTIASTTPSYTVEIAQHGTRRVCTLKRDNGPSTLRPLHGNAEDCQLFKIVKPVLSQIHEEIVTATEVQGLTTPDEYGGARVAAEKPLLMSNLAESLKNELGEHRMALRVKSADKHQEAVGNFIFFSLLGEEYAGKDVELAPSEKDLTHLNQSLYVTLGFAMDLEDLNKLSRLWREMPQQLKTMQAGELGPPPMDALTADESLDYEHWSQDKVFVLGILGKTGAGKSTLTNAMMRREATPVSSDICTGAPVELVYTAGEELAEVVFLPQDVRARFMDKQRKQVELRRSIMETACAKKNTWSAAIKNTWSAAKAAAACEESTKEKDAEAQKLQAMEVADTEAAKVRARVPMADLSHFASAADGNVMPLFVQKVTTFLNSPILQHVKLVDTPGLSDPDPDRSQVSTQALKEMDTVLFVIDAGQKPDDDVIKQMKLVREVNSHVTIIAAFSKVNTLSTTEGKNIDEILAQRRKAYRDYANNPAHIPGFQGKGITEAVRLLSATRQDQQKIASGLKKASYGLNSVQTLYPEWAEDEQATDDLVSAYSRVMKNPTANSDLLVNIQVEASGLLEMMSQLRVHMHEEAVVRNQQKSQAALNAIMTTRLPVLKSQLLQDQSELKGLNEQGEDHLHQLILKLHADKVKAEETHREYYYVRAGKAAADFAEMERGIRFKANEIKEEAISVIAFSVRAEFDDHTTCHLVFDLFLSFLCFSPWCWGYARSAVNLFNIFDQPLKTRLSMLAMEVKTYFERLIRQEDGYPAANGQFQTLLTQRLEWEFDEDRYLEFHEHFLSVGVGCPPQCFDLGEAHNRLFKLSLDSVRARGESFMALLWQKLDAWRALQSHAFDVQAQHWKQRAGYLEGELQNTKNSEKRRQQLKDRIPRLEHDIKEYDALWKRAQILNSGSDAGAWTVGTNGEVQQTRLEI